ncbi:hypothetical protein OROHE_006033 [Orobanche hederae]
MTLMLWLLLILLVPFSQPLENAGSPAPASVSSTGEIFASADAMLVNVSQSETPYDAESLPLALSAKEERLWSIVTTNSLDFDAWTDLIDETESTTEGNISKIRKVYADHEECFISLEKAAEVYERAVQEVPYSVDMWLIYCVFGVRAYKDSESIRRQFLVNDYALQAVCGYYWCYDIEVIFSRTLTCFHQPSATSITEV